MNDPLGPIAEVMRRNGVAGRPEDFHAAVNVCFHQFESEVYDDLHQDMWQSLPQQGELLANDCLREGAPDTIRMLDIGCGTGLATDMILRTALGPKIVEVDLIDTSTAMLARAERRRKAEWKKPGESMEGLVQSLVGRKSYDLIITCSVLHHVPDLPAFLQAVAALQSGNPGALFLHLQDPNGDYLKDPQLRERSAQMSQKVPNSIARFTPKRIFGRVMREIKGEQGQDYLSKANRELIKRGVISKPLSAGDMFAITDIHIRDGGICIRRMEEWLPDYKLVSNRAYAFFGVLRSELPAKLQMVEDECIRNGALNGEYVAAAWRRA
jgi:2-polyprenyl-3-methyl-5-hydroxy-6-metoxy-1,4-benzoquinol methylase